MGRRTRLSARMLDGRVIEGTSSTYMCGADRIMFERRFRVGAGVMKEWRALYDDGGQPKPDADMSIVREEYLTFFAWRALKRLRPNETEQDFDAFLENLEEFEQIDEEDEQPGEPGEPDPTTATMPAPPTS